MVFTTVLYSSSSSADWLPNSFTSPIVSAVDNTCIDQPGSGYVLLKSYSQGCRSSLPWNYTNLPFSWVFGGVSKNTFRISLNFLTCLDDYKREDNVGTWECHGGDNQEWMPKITSRLYDSKTHNRKFKLITGNNYCLANVSGLVIVEPCNGGADQNWYLPGLDGIRDDETVVQLPPQHPTPPPIDPRPCRPICQIAR